MPRVTKPKRQLDKHPLTQLYHQPGVNLPLTHSLNRAHGSLHDMLTTMNLFPPCSRKTASGLVSLATLDYEPMHAIEHIVPPCYADSVVQRTKLDLDFICC